MNLSCAASRRPLAHIFVSFLFFLFFFHCPLFFLFLFLFLLLPSRSGMKQHLGSRVGGGA